MAATKVGLKRRKIGIKRPPVEGAPPLKPMIAPVHRVKSKLLKDAINRNEDYRDQLNKEIGATTELAVVLDEDTVEAHNLYLFGKKGQRPVRDLEELSRLTGVPVRRLEIVAPAWRREAMRLAREASPLFAMASTTKARTDHHKDLEKMRARIDRYEERMPDITHKDFPAKLRILMMMRKEWQDSAGITAAINLSQACMMMEAKMMIQGDGKPKIEGDDEDLSAFDVDV